MEATDLRTEFSKETKTRFNTEWLAYNDYVDWLEQKLVKLLTIPHVVGRSEQLVCDCSTCGTFDKCDCDNCLQYDRWRPKAN